jgi:aconitate hydratase
LRDVEKKALVSLDNNNIDYKLTDKIHNGRLYVEQGVIAGCAGGGFENLCDAADILRGTTIGADEFSLSVYPASQPIFMELVKNGVAADLMATGATLRTAFCGPCFGAGDVPSNKGLSIRHSTRNFPNREGSKVTNGQIASVALMDARSIAATAANKGYLTAATDIDVNFTKPKYYFDKSIYDNRVFNGVGKADPSVEIKFGPNIVDWPEMEPLTDHVLLKMASVIDDPVTTTDELIPSGETSSYRSNPLGLAEFTLSRKDPAYVGKAKEIQKIEKARLAGNDMYAEDEQLQTIFNAVKSKFSDVVPESVEVGSVIFANKPGDGSAREQAASCQRVLGGLANIALEYATKRYRSNLINWGMLPFVLGGEVTFEKDDYIFVKDIKNAIETKNDSIKAYLVNKDMKEIELHIGNLTDDEREIILKGCLINYNKKD